MDKENVAEILQEIGVLLELKGENPFKTRAYASAARTIEGLSESLEKLISENRLGEIKGIGDALQKKITELVTTGELAYYEELKASLPAGLLDMLKIPGMGPKKVKAVYDRLGVETVDQLEQACRSGRVAMLDGFGEKSQAKILEGIQFRRQYATRHLLVQALAWAEPILDELRAHPDVLRCSTAGSVRRFKEVIGDVDFLVSSKAPAAVLDFFTGREGVMKVLAKGDTKSSVILEGGIQADLRVVSDVEYPYALAYFTGSKEHNIAMRQRAIQRGLRLNEYGLFRSKEETRDPELRVACATEDEIFSQLGLAYIPPELREDHGEFLVAETGTMPRLVEWTDLKGSLHNHSNWSDGRGTVAEIAEFARENGFAYWAINDHSRASFQAHGLDADRLRKQVLEIREVNRRLSEEGCEFRLLTGVEVDILGDGRLDLPDDVLEDLDVVVASLHQGFSRQEPENTRRLIRAAENRQVHMLGHLTGRLLLEREPYPVNPQAVIDVCAETGTWIELNAHPARFDLDWRLWPYAKSMGVKCVINCDAHRNEHAGFLRLGAGIARKGGLQREDVINTLSLRSLMKALQGKREGGRRS
ncbi:MAG TPA: DNA polymerase/3'-5' exonuclease PolX [Candidatus Paceibacterota bacterium]|nr:DNA polymerase/3'-5' exonuclease PolX [Verrucomicrobiota bacterium]HRY46855.1 DNA polymerase/3'-5' exonuclease PolX [Candidatus Paceibacterota bacterium]HSA03513.1 DNA polymerase/3'-5' exonuclease PolX [Candidatus Paceibacterota bacterium]